MIAIPSALKIKFEDRLTEKAIPRETHGFYTKWLRYYLDFCHKYHFPYAKKESLAPFLRKLDEKKTDKGTTAAGFGRGCGILRSHTGKISRGKASAGSKVYRQRTCRFQGCKTIPCEGNAKQKYRLSKGAFSKRDARFRRFPAKEPGPG